MTNLYTTLFRKRVRTSSGSYLRSSRNMLPKNTSSPLLRYADHVPISEPITVARGMQLPSINHTFSWFPTLEASSETQELLGDESDAQQVARIVGSREKKSQKWLLVIFTGARGRCYQWRADQGTNQIIKKPAYWKLLYVTVWKLKYQLWHR